MSVCVWVCVRVRMCACVCARAFALRGESRRLLHSELPLRGLSGAGARGRALSPSSSWAAPTRRRQQPVPPPPARRGRPHPRFLLCAPSWSLLVSSEDHTLAPSAAGFGESPHGAPNPPGVKPPIRAQTVMGAAAGAPTACWPQALPHDPSRPHSGHPKRRTQIQGRQGLWHAARTEEAATGSHAGPSLQQEAGSPTLPSRLPSSPHLGASPPQAVPLLPAAQRSGAPLHVTCPRRKASPSGCGR